MSFNNNNPRFGWQNNDKLFGSTTKEASEYIERHSPEGITQRMLKAFIKDNKDLIHKDIEAAYTQSFTNDNVMVLPNLIARLKNNSNAFFLDVYNDNKAINTHMTEQGYIRYANRLLNDYIKHNVFVSE